MKRKISSILAAVLVGSMIVGTTAFAADSSTTSNTESTSIVETTEARAGNTIYAVPTGKNEGTATVGGTRITANYSEVTVPGSIETAVVAPANEAATKVLDDYVKANINDGILVLKTKLRLYKAGQAINTGFGVLKQSFGVGNKYDGRTAIVYQIHQNGSITSTSAVVTNGKINISVTDLGTFYIVISNH
ncbi:MAG: hypothetical protein IJ695_10635 [Butyrivibrio sp.]|nr:hypothetical protein [Butyrivibrio sp.]